MCQARSATGEAVSTGPRYERHRPEQTLLYQLIERHYPAFQTLLSAQGNPLPVYVQQEFEAYLKCGRLEYDMLRVRCGSCHAERLVAFSCKKRGFCPSCCARRMVENAALLVDEVLPKEPMRQLSPWMASSRAMQEQLPRVLSVPFQLRFPFAGYPQLMGKALGIVYRTIATYLIHQAGFTHSSARTGAVTFIQRFGSALNLNVHFHILFLDGVYISGFDKDKQVFRRVKTPTQAELQTLVHKISKRLARFLTKEGLLTEDVENSTLTLDHLEPNPLQQLHGHSITYRIAVGPQQGRKVSTLQTLLPKEGNDTYRQVGKLGGFSLHAGVSTAAHQRRKLERICRYVARPAVSEKRLALTRDGRVRYELKTPYRDGTTHVIFEPLDFLARLAALVPRPRVNLTRFHGVFAPNSQYRVRITPAKRGKGARDKDKANSELDDRTPIERRASMTWAQRLKRVFNIDITECEKCQGAVKIIACIEDPILIDKILSHLKAKEAKTIQPLPQVRAPPQYGLLEQGKLD